MRALLFTICAAGVAAAQETRTNDLSWVEKRVREWQPKASERKFDQIGWAPDVRTALALAKKHNRPLYIFMYDGRTERGRC